MGHFIFIGFLDCWNAGDVQRISKIDEMLQETIGQISEEFQPTVMRGLMMTSENQTEMGFSSLNCHLIKDELLQTN